ncbi:etoposide-induced protein 2.4 homolog [Rhagoletis pomonella]|uniref:etoposide-induced protein 2.4 homolog n=1 Tax=Rhagoletis pomonella TaxID=28610 RepID=UPI00177E130B|nr:etoposide-induced protein 2.4 homolog [Rhagoletis pomonella]
MEAIKNISLGIIYGLWDSIKGMTLLLHIDAEIHKINAEKEAEKQRRIKERERRHHRTPSPTPSSAAAMAREELKELLQVSEQEKPDERSLNSMLKRTKASQSHEPKPEKKIAKQVLKCCLLNGGFTWLSIILFEQLLLPALRFVLSLFYGNHTSELNMVWGWVQPILSIIFGMMWVLPIFLLSKIVSSLWFADIANAAYRVRKGQPQLIPNISKLIADFLFNLLVQALFLVQSMLVNLLPVPYLGEALCFLHLCLLYSLYSFEYKWFNMGWELHRRLSYIENNWPYFLGFGIPLTVLTNMTNSVIVSSCIFSIFFPLFILSGNEAIPIVDTTNFPLRLFSPVIFTSNLLFTRGRPAKLTAAKLAQQKKQLLQQQEKQLQQHMLLQQRIEEEYLGRSRSRQEELETTEDLGPQRRQSSRFSNSPSPTRGPYRYQQPPSQPRIPSTTRNATVFPDRTQFIGGVSPSVPSSASSSAHSVQTVRRR